MRVILTITGPSCAGKTTFAEKLAEDTSYEIIPTYTTRPPRGVEEPHYIFMTDEAFEEEEGFLEVNEFNGYKYGTTFDSIESILRQSKVAVKVMEPNGVATLNTYRANLGFAHVKVWVGGPTELLKERMKNRETARNIEQEKAWYSELHWNYTIKELDDTSIDKHISKLKYLIPTLAKNPGMRVWGN
jgi:guanylate kinase